MRRLHPWLVELGRNVRAARRSTGLSQERFAAVAGLDRTYIGGIERGERNVAVINILRIAVALRIEPGGLLPTLRTALASAPQRSRR